MAMHTLTANRIRLSLSLQAPFSLFSGSPLCDFRLAIGRNPSGSGSGYTHRHDALSPLASLVLGAHSHAALGQMGRLSRLERDVPKSDEVLATAP